MVPPGHANANVFPAATNPAAPGTMCAKRQPRGVRPKTPSSRFHAPGAHQVQDAPSRHANHVTDSNATANQSPSVSITPPQQ